MAKSNDTVTLSVIVTKEMREQLEKVAKEEERTLSWIMRKAIQDYLDSKEN